MSLPAPYETQINVRLFDRDTATAARLDFTTLPLSTCPSRPSGSCALHLGFDSAFTRSPFSFTRWRQKKKKKLSFKLLLGLGSQPATRVPNTSWVREAFPRKPSLSHCSESPPRPRTVASLPSFIRAARSVAGLRPGLVCNGTKTTSQLSKPQPGANGECL